MDQFGVYVTKKWEMMSIVFLFWMTFGNDSSKVCVKVEWKAEWDGEMDCWRSWREGIWLVILCSTCSSSFWVRWRRLLWECLLSLCCDWLSREWNTLLTSGVRFLVPSQQPTSEKRTSFPVTLITQSISFRYVWKQPPSAMSLWKIGVK